MSDYKIETKCLHTGWRPGNGEPRQLPIIQSTTFKFDTSEEMAALFDLAEPGYFYTRLANPTSDAVAAKIAALEGGVGGVMTSSGQAASLFSVLNIASAGDNIISLSSIYGGTYNLFAVTLPKMGIEVRFVDPDASDEELDAVVDERTKAVFGETIANPALRIFDIERFADFAHRHGVPLIVDNTFATPINCRPLEWGADIIVHSTTKYMDGHGATVGGCVVDGGKFDWTKYPDRYPGLTTPDESYHGLVFCEAFGAAAYNVKMVATLMRDIGATPAQMNAFLVNLGLETLHLRMERHVSNANNIARRLAEDERISWITYPDLPGNQDHVLQQKYLPKGSCGVISFGVKGGRAAAMRFMAALRLAMIATHVADARTCVLHPASSTHRQLSDEQLIEAGVRPDLIRLSVGIENWEDIWRDLDQALAAAQG
ncbi:MAG: bifunctional O-acetylhomoserine aminocarboxypropyltransferase/cysteine synthase [Clostridiaceae bacterium]|nr:bifunctional O-acetylhomoserine aminocarboxypropyltransferase/cysteine synthase [Clostridiaceae bacterium]